MIKTPEISYYLVSKVLLGVHLVSVLTFGLMPLLMVQSPLLRRHRYCLHHGVVHYGVRLHVGQAAGL